jgi:hypothetical protein
MKKIIFSQKEKDKLKQQYEFGKSTYKLSQEYGISVNVISKCLKEMGIEIRGKRIALNDEVLDEIRTAYETGTLTVKQIALKHGYSEKLVYKRLHEMNVRMKDAGTQRKYCCNESYFDNIDTPEKAYWLGFIFADGCITKNRGSYAFQLTLSSKDSSHLIRFLTEVESNHPIYNGVVKDNRGKCFPNSKIQFYSSSHFCERLVELGAVERKSLVLDFPNEDEIPEQYLSHFIRGYFDGDGCLSSTHRGKTNTPSDIIFILTFTGTYQFLSSLKKFLPLSRNIEVIQSSGNGKSFEIRIGGQQQIKRVLEYMYDGATVFLNRKKDKYDDFQKYLEMVKLHISHFVLTNEQVKRIQLIFSKYQELGSIKSVKDYFNKIGLKTFRGNKYSSRGLLDILRRKAFSEAVLVDGNLISIITSEQFNQVQYQLDRNRDDIELRTRAMIKYMKNKKTNDIR